MLKKRFIGTILVRDGWAVQSFGYARYLPVGRPEIVAENLDRWGADEILVLAIDRSARQLGPDLGLVQRLGSMGLSTPLAYGGGIRNADEAGAIVKAGADRVCVDALLHRDADAVRGIARLVGAQALIAALPASIRGADFELRDHLSGHPNDLSPNLVELFEDRVVSEALLIDWRNEGRPDGFDVRLIERFPLPSVPVIAFGGISSPAQMRELLSNERIVAVAVGNFLAYREHAVQHLKRATASDGLREAVHAAETAWT